MTLEQYIGMTIRSKRKELGWPQADLAALTGITDTTLSNIENGRHSARMEIIAALFISLGLDLRLISDLVCEKLLNDERYLTERERLLQKYTMGLKKY